MAANYTTSTGGCQAVLEPDELSLPQGGGGVPSTVSRRLVRRGWDDSSASLGNERIDIVKSVLKAFAMIDFIHVVDEIRQVQLVPKRKYLVGTCIFIGGVALDQVNEKLAGLAHSSVPRIYWERLGSPVIFSDSHMSNTIAGLSL